jgi:hypothetical protein
MVSKDFFQEVRELGLPPGSYALFGSAQLCVRDLRQCHDMDVIVTEAVWQACLREPGWTASVAPSGSPSLKKNDIELVNSWRPGTWDIEKLIADAEMIEGLPFVKMEDVLRWKKMNGREKDAQDVEMIERYLRSRD